MKKNFLLTVSITNETEDQILKYILLSLEKLQEKFYIVTPNPEILVYANKHQEFKSILNNARLALPDGVGVILAGKILGKPFTERVTGVDLLEKLCQEASKKPITVGFLGGGPKIAERTAECLVKKYPGLKVVFANSEWPNRGPVKSSFPASAPSKPHKSSDEVRAVGIPPAFATPRSIDILFVAYGFPKQEEWMAENLKKIPVKVAMSVGGAFDYISGNVSRAPLLIRLIGFEWFYRLIAQPWRIKRQLALLEFIFLVFKERLLATSGDGPQIS